MSGTAVRAGRAFVEVFLKDQVTANLRGMVTRLRAMSRLVAGLGAALTATAVTIATPVAFATKTFADFDDAMRQVKAVTGATEVEFRSLTDTAKELGRTTSFTAVQVAALMAELGRAGFDPTQIENMTSAVLNLARATDTDATQASGIMAASIRQFNLEASEAGRVADGLTAAANKSFNTVEQLGDALKFAGPVASDFNLSFEDTLAILGGLGNVGIQASLAGTALRRLLTLSGAEAKRMEDIFGVSFVDSAGNARPLVEVLGEVNDATKDLGSAARAEKFNEAFGLLGITGASAIGRSAGDIRELADEIKAAGGTAAETAAEMDAGLGGSLRRLLSAVEGVKIAIGEALAPVLGQVVDGATEAAGAVTQFIEKNKAVLVVAAGAVAGIGLLGTGLTGLAIAAWLASTPIAILAGVTSFAGGVLGATVSIVRSLAAGMIFKRAATISAAVAMRIYAAAATVARVGLVGLAGVLGLVRVAVIGLRATFITAGAAIALVRSQQLAFAAGAAVLGAVRTLWTAVVASIVAVRAAMTLANAQQLAFAAGAAVLGAVRAIWTSVVGSIVAVRAAMTLANAQQLAFAAGTAALAAVRAVWAGLRATVTGTGIAISIVRGVSLATSAAMALMSAVASGGATAMGLLSGALAVVQAAALGPIAPIAAIAAAVVGLGAVLFVNRESIFDFLGNSLSGLQPILASVGAQWSSFAGSVSQWFGAVVSEAKVAWDGISAAIAVNDLQAAWTIAWNTMKLVALKTFGPLQLAWNEFTTGLISMFDTAIVAIRQAWNTASTAIAQTMFTVLDKIQGLLDKIADYDPSGVAARLSEALDFDTEGIQRLLDEENERFGDQLDRDKRQRDEQRGADLAEKQAALAKAMAESEAAIRKARDDAVAAAKASKAEQDASLSEPEDSYLDRLIDDTDALMAEFQQIMSEAQTSIANSTSKGGVATDISGTFSSVAALFAARGAGGAGSPEERTAKATEDALQQSQIIAQNTANIDQQINFLGTLG